MRLLSIISDWGSLMWSCVMTGLATFIGGFWLAKRVYDRRRIASELSSVQTVLAESLVPNRRTLIVAWLCLSVGIAVVAYEYHLLGEIPVLSDTPDVARVRLFGGNEPQFDKLYLKLLHVFVEFLKYGVFLAFIVLFQKNKKSKKAVLACVCIILLGTLAYGSQAGRTFIVAIAITGVVLFHYLRRRIRLAVIVSSVALLFLFIGVFGLIRFKQGQTAPIFERAFGHSDFPEGDFWEGIAFGYTTTTISLEVFYRLAEDLKTIPRPQGGFLFYSLHRFVPRTSLGEVSANLYSGESTTSTFLGDFYGDYGYWGVLFGPLVMGFLYGWAYSHTGGQRPLYWVYVRAMLLQMLVFFPYVNLFSLYLTWIFDLCFMYFLIGRLTAQEGQQFPPVTAKGHKVPVAA